MTARCRATLVLVAAALAVAGCAGVTRSIDIPRAKAPFDSKRWPATVSGYLTGQPFVRKDRVVIQGLSHGGWTVLRALDEILYGTNELRFAAGVAYYPVCSGIQRPLYAPALVLIGELDDWTPAIPCQALSEQAREDPYPIDLTVYPRAYPSFDFPGARRVNQYGKVLEHSRDATTDAERRVDQFLRRLFPAP